MKKPLLIGIAGGSGSGKTSLAKQLQQRLQASCTILAQDSYYIDQSHRFDRDGGNVNFDHPSSLDFPLLAQHLQQLRQGQTIAVPVYDFASHTRKPITQPLAATAVILVEGTLLFSQEAILQQLDYRIFVDAPESIRFERRLRRDVQERGRTPEGVHTQFYGQVKPMHDLFVEPSQARADWTVSGTEGLETTTDKVLARIQELLTPGTTEATLKIVAAGNINSSAGRADGRAVNETTTTNGMSGTTRDNHNTAGGVSVGTIATKPAATDPQPEPQPEFLAHLFICTNTRDNGKKSCGSCGGAELRDQLKAHFKSWKHPLKNKIRINQSGCLGWCEQGPVAVLYPSGQWFLDIKPGDTATIVKAVEHLVEQAGEKNP